MNKNCVDDDVTAAVDNYHKLKAVADVAYRSACLKIRTKLIDPLVISWSEALSQPIIKLINEELNQINYPFDDYQAQKSIKRDLTQFQKYLELLDQVT